MRCRHSRFQQSAKSRLQRQLKRRNQIQTGALTAQREHGFPTATVAMVGMSREQQSTEQFQCVQKYDVESAIPNVQQ